MPLTGKQQSFVEHYASTGNATESAKLAGYSAKTAHVIGSNLLKHPGVGRALAHVEARKIGETIDRVNGAVLAREEVIRGLQGIAESREKGVTSASKVSAWRAIAEIEGYLGRGRDTGDVAALTGIRIEIKGADGSSVKVDTAQAVKQLTGRADK